MRDGLDLLVAQDALDERLVAEVADDERHVLGHREAHAR